MPPFVRGIRAAFGFLTLLPCGGWPFSAADWRWAAAHHPLVGATLGALLALVWHASEARLGPWSASTLTVSAGLILTGALHEDALADTADALGAGGNSETMLAILKDSRIGTYGAAALCVSFSCRTSLLAALGSSAPFALIAVHAAARVPPVWLMSSLPYVTPASTSRSGFAATSRPLQAAVATSWATIALGGCVMFRGLSLEQAAAVAGAGIVIGAASARTYRKRMGGVTGDLLGATEQICESSMLLAAAWIGAAAGSG